MSPRHPDHGSSGLHGGPGTIAPTAITDSRIAAGQIMGLSRHAALEFSFYLAIPVMFAATGYDLLKSLDTLSVGDVPFFAVGFLVSFLSALAIVKVFLSYVGNHSFTLFAWYRIAFGALLLLWAR